MPMLDALETVNVKAGERVVSEGDPGGPMYIVRDGKLVADQGEGDAREDMGFLRTGDFFGELSLYLGEPRAATVEALTDAELLRMGESTLQHLLAEHEEFRTRVEDRIASYEQRHRPVPARLRRRAAAGRRKRGGDCPADRGGPRCRRRRGRRSGRAAGAGATVPAQGALRPPGEVPVRSPARRDGLRCRVGRDDLSLLRPGGLDRRDSPGRRHVRRRNQPARHPARRRARRPCRAPAEGLEGQDRHAAIAGDHPLGRQPLGDRLRRGRRHDPPRRPGARLAQGQPRASWRRSGAAMRRSRRRPPRWRRRHSARPARSGSWPFIEPHKKVLIACFVLALAGAGLDMLSPVVSQQIIDHVFGRRNKVGLLDLLTGGMVAAAAAEPRDRHDPAPSAGPHGRRP